MPTLYTVLRAQHRHAPSITEYTGKRAPTHGYPAHTSLDAQRKALREHFTPLQRASFRDSPNRLWLRLLRLRPAREPHCEVLRIVFQNGDSPADSLVWDVSRRK